MHIINADCCDVLRRAAEKGVRWDMIFADPPDNLGLGYGEYNDNLPDASYYDWLETVISLSLPLTQTLWLSYYWKHDLEIKYRLRHILRYRHPAFKAKTLIWRFTFGQHNKSDCGSGFRYLLRVSRLDHWNTDDIRVTSTRQLIGDKRANPDGRVPDDVWDFPRVVGNSPERRAYHPTQHPEALYTRVIKLTNPANFVDLFAGSGTCFRAAKACGVECVGVELDKLYCGHLATEHNLPIEQEL